MSVVVLLRKAGLNILIKNKNVYFCSENFDLIMLEISFSEQMINMQKEIDLGHEINKNLWYSIRKDKHIYNW